MVDTVVQGVKALQDLSRLRVNFLSKRTKGGTKFVERTGQVAEVFKVDQLGGEVGRVWEWQWGGSELDWLGNKQRVPGKRDVGNALVQEERFPLQKHDLCSSWWLQQYSEHSEPGQTATAVQYDSKRECCQEHEQYQASELG